MTVSIIVVASMGLWRGELLAGEKARAGSRRAPLGGRLAKG